EPPPEEPPPEEPPPANTRPTITGTPPSTVQVGEQYRFRPTARDADGDTLTFDIVNAPEWADFDESTGRLSGTPGAGDVRTWSDIRISVSDREEVAWLGPFSITVEAVATGSATLTWNA